MSVELPFAPVDSIIRRNAGDLRVGSAATERLTRHIQRRGAELAVEAAERAAADGRKTLMAEDFGVDPADRDALELPIAPIDRIARLDIDDSFRVAADARVALATHLEREADRIAAVAVELTRHADRRTVTEADVERYFAIESHFE